VRGDTVVVRVKSERKAFLYSLVPTVAGYTLVVVATAVGERRVVDGQSEGWTAPALYAGVALAFAGPGTGHEYAGQRARVLEGIRIRTGGILLGSAGGLIYGALFLGNVFGSDGDEDGGRSGVKQVGLALVLAGSAVVIGSSFYDIATAPRSARRTNEQAARRRAQVSFAPVVAPRQGVGAHVAVRF